MSREPFVINRIKSVGFALKGLFILLRTESSFQIQIVIGVVMTIIGYYFEISNIEWMCQFICIGMVIGIEGLNTAVEKLADFVQPEFNEKIGLIKDVSAGAVMAVSIISIIIGCIIYIPKVV